MGVRPFQKAVTRFGEGSAVKAARMERAVEKANFESISLQKLRGAARFVRKLGRADVRGKLKREAEGLRHELCYFKASSNGLMKGLKNVMGLPIKA